MKGGLPPGIAYALSDDYFQYIEQITDINLLHKLVIQIQEDYCTRVAEILSPDVPDDILLRSMQYVQYNTNKRIRVSDVAEHVGYSTSYLSRKFKKETGFALNDFIKRCKLEESKMLLTYSSKSISQISNYLCFSSQSHFQRVFKEQYGITPYHFRHQNSNRKPH